MDCRTSGPQAFSVFLLAPFLSHCLLHRLFGSGQAHPAQSNNRALLEANLHWVPLDNTLLIGKWPSQAERQEEEKKRDIEKEQDK